MLLQERKKDPLTALRMRALLKLKKAASLVLDQIAKIQDLLTSMWLVLARDFQAFKLILKWY